MSKQLPEAIHKFNEYWECPVGCNAVYHEYSFTHRNFMCKDCNKEFLVPEHIKLNKPEPFKKKPKPDYKRPNRESNNA